MLSETDWQAHVRNLLKAEIKRRGMSYSGLADLLHDLGIEESAANIANKLSRGGFSAVFLVQCLTAMGCETLRLSD